MNSKIKFDLIRPTQLGGARSFLNSYIFVCDHSFLLKIDFLNLFFCFLAAVKFCQAIKTLSNLAADNWNTESVLVHNRHYCRYRKAERNACDPSYEYYSSMTHNCWFTCTDGACPGPAGNDKACTTREIPHNQFPLLNPLLKSPLYISVLGQEPLLPQEQDSGKCCSSK